MRLVAVLLLMLCAEGAMALSQSGDKKVSVNVENVDVAAVMQAIFTQAGANYALAGDVGGQVTAHIDDQPLDAALKSVLKPVGCVWSQSDGIYIVRKRHDASQIAQASTPVSHATYGAAPKTPSAAVKPEAKVAKIQQDFGMPGNKLPGPLQKAAAPPKKPAHRKHYLPQRPPFRFLPAQGIILKPGVQKGKKPG